MFNLGFFEIVVIVVLALVLLGPDQIPEVARTIGKMVRDFKRASNEITDSFQREARKIEEETSVKETLKKEITDKLLNFSPDTESISFSKKDSNSSSEVAFENESQAEESMIENKDSKSSDLKTSSLDKNTLGKSLSNTDPINTENINSSPDAKNNNFNSTEQNTETPTNVNSKKENKV